MPPGGKSPREAKVLERQKILADESPREAIVHGLQMSPGGKCPREATVPGWRQKKIHCIGMEYFGFIDVLSTVLCEYCSKCGSEGRIIGLT